MNVSVSSTSLNEDNLKNLQINLMRALASWTNGTKTLSPVTPDLPDVVSILRCLGYQIRRVDTCAPDTVSPLRNNERGNRVIITCCYSGSRCYMELPHAKENCKCVLKTDDPNKDAFWEVSATVASNSQSDSVVESGSELLPKISKDMLVMTNYLLRMLLHMLHLTPEFENNASFNSSSSCSLYSITSQTKATSSPKVNAKRLSGFLKEMGVNPPIILSPRGVQSPARYRSLDALHKNVSENNQENVTTKTPVKSVYNKVVLSSPNIYLAPTKDETSGSSSSTLGDTKVSKLSQLLVEAIAVLHGKQLNEVTELLNNASQSGKKSVGSVKRTGSASSKNSIKAAIKSTIASVCTNTRKSTPSSNVNNVKAVKSTKEEDLSVNKTRVVKSATKSKDMYAHIKSTIPKSNFTTKKK